MLNKKDKVMAAIWNTIRMLLEKYEEHKGEKCNFKCNFLYGKEGSKQVSVVLEGVVVVSPLLYDGLLV